MKNKLRANELVDTVCLSEGDTVWFGYAFWVRSAPYKMRHENRVWTSPGDPLIERHLFEFEVIAVSTPSIEGKWPRSVYPPDTLAAIRLLKAHEGKNAPKKAQLLHPNSYNYFYTKDEALKWMEVPEGDRD